MPVRIALVALALGTAPLPLHAAGFFVSINGNNANSGAINSPWQSIEIATDRLSPGDTLYIRAGHYFQAPVVVVSGAPGAEIVVRSYPGEQVVIDSGIPEPQVAGNTAWELVDPAIGEYRTVAPLSGGTVLGYVDGIPGYANGRVALVPYQSDSCFRATTDQFGPAFYVGPGTYADTTTGRIHIRLSKTIDMVAAEARYGQVFPTDHADPSQYSIILSRATYTLRVSASHLIFRDLTFNQAKGTIQLTAEVHHVTFDGVTAWMGNRSIEVTGANVHDITVTRCRLYGDNPYWIFWSDMKDVPAPADEMRASSLDLRYEAHDWEIAYNHIRGSGQDLIGTNTNEYNIRIHHNRLENAGDDALELEGTVAVGRIEVFENYILNCLTALAPGQGTPVFNGPLLVYRNVICLLRDPPVNRQVDLNPWNGGKRFGYEYMFKQNGPAYSTANTHYYHNTLVMLNTDTRGLNLTPRHPTDTRIANNLCVMVNGVVNDIYLTDVGQVLDGNLYWKVNSVDSAHLLNSYDDVTSFSAASGLEVHGLGAVSKRGTNPGFMRFDPHVVDSTQVVWALSPAGETPRLTHFMLSASSPARGAAIAIPPHPVLGPLPDTRESLDLGAIPFGTPVTAWTAFPFNEPPDAIGTGCINQAPTVEAGPSRSMTTPGSLTLEGAVSDDLVPDPLTLTTAWEQVSGPASVSFANPAAAQTQATFPAPGFYLLRLTASDGLASASDSTTVIVRPLMVIERRIVASSDDAEEGSTGSLSITSSDLEMMNVQRIVGMRFKNLGIPPGATITAAYVQFKVDEVQTAGTDVLIRGQATPNPPTFAGNGNVWNRPRTSGVVLWSIPAWSTIGAAAAAQRTPDLSALIQEILTAAGTQRLDSLVLVVTGAGHRTADSYDGDPDSAPLLHVEFALPAVLDAGGRSEMTLAPQVIPHPLRGLGLMSFSTRRAGPARLDLHDTQGRRVRTFMNADELPAGSHRIPLDGRDDQGGRLRSGVYFYRLATTAGVASGRVLIVR